MYDEKRLRLAVIGEDLLKCSEISRLEGLLAMEAYVPKLKGGSRFLAFAIPYILNFHMEQIESEEAFHFLENYVMTLPEAERTEGNMIKAFAGHEDISITQKCYIHQVKSITEYASKFTKGFGCFWKSGTDFINKKWET